MSHPVFGDALLQKKDGGKLSSVEALSSKKFVLLYFSAHWCPPCRKFTPKLVEWYNEYSEAQNFECVFVSGDETQESFDDYYKDMPWLALPFENRDLETELSAKFGIKGIPTLLVLGPDGEVITDKGRAGVELKPAEIPWAPILKKSSSVLDALRLFGDLTRADGSTLSVESLCKEFTPILKGCYESLKSRGVDMEVVFVSSDKSREEFDGYIKDQPWVALPYSHPSFFGANEFLQDKLEVDGMPTLVLFDAKGEVSIADATGRVSNDPTGLNFPWPPSPWCALDDAMEAINDYPHLIAFTDNLEEGVASEVEKSCKAMLDEISAPFFNKEKGELSEKIRFAWAGKGRAAFSVRHFCGLQSDQSLEEAKKHPRFIIIDVPSRVKIALPSAPGPRGLGMPSSAEALVSFVETATSAMVATLNPVFIKDDMDPDAPKEHGHSHGGAPCGGHGH